MNFMLVADIRSDRIFRIGEIEEVITGTQEYDARSAADFLEPEDFGVEFFRAIEVLDRDGEVKNAFGLEHGSFLPAERRARNHAPARRGEDNMDQWRSG
jgi:hypothetical protein